MNYEDPQQGLPFYNKTLRNPLIRVEGNIIVSEYDMLQISSIARVGIGHIPPPAKSIKPMVLGILFVLLGFGSFILWKAFKNQPLLYIAGALILVGIICILRFLLKKQSTSIYALNIQLNSGSNYAFVSNMSNFITDESNVLHNILLDGNREGTNYVLTTKLFCGHCGVYMIGESGTRHRQSKLFCRMM